MWWKKRQRKKYLESALMILFLEILVGTVFLCGQTETIELKDQILEKLKATQKRGFAKETGYILEIKKTDDCYEILPEDFEGGESEDTVEVQQAGVNIGALTGMSM